jgi:hypothetical protein
LIAAFIKASSLEASLLDFKTGIPVKAADQKLLNRPGSPPDEKRLLQLHAAGL